MRKTLRTLIGGAAISATAGIPLAAQVVREGARSSPADAEISFGYLCDDRFVVRNESDKQVKLEYGLNKNDERTSLSLERGESVELLLSTSDDLSLFAGGTVIATARREYRDCDEVEGRSRIVVRPLSVVVAPRIVVASYGYPSYRVRHYDPWHHHHTYFRPVIRPVIRIPIVIGRRGGDRGRDDRDRGRDNRGRDSRGRDNGRRGR